MTKDRKDQWPVNLLQTTNAALKLIAAANVTEHKLTNAQKDVIRSAAALLESRADPSADPTSMARAAVADLLKEYF